ncbi:MAG: hypothetical protein L6R36_007013 [Xanthoria steineri]|nr:MAG: hypothetical protein L6R36_007013 [Xanthoria steineri]
MEVRENSRGETWPGHAIMWRADNHTDSEHVRCANETGVVGRFQQQIGHVMTCVGSDLDPDMHLYFPDWWDEGAKVPDLTVWSANTRPLIVGEVKTPWTLDLEDIMSHEPHRGQRFVGRFMRSAGQVADYMKEYGFKYGFLTTYKETIFFKQEILTFDNELASINQISLGPESQTDDRQFSVETVDRKTCSYLFIAKLVIKSSPEAVSPQGQRYPRGQHERT